SSDVCSSDLVELTATWPESTVSRPARQCISVDLPDPDGPIMAVKSPGRNDTDTSLRAATFVSAAPNVLVMLWAATAAGCVLIVMVPVCLLTTLTTSATGTICYGKNSFFRMRLMTTTVLTRLSPPDPFGW